ncbi:MAG: PepSY domain-containing protein [Candidatus Thiodiazotropha sp.]
MNGWRIWILLLMLGQGQWVVAGEDAHDAARRLTEQGVILPLHEILTHLGKLQKGRVLELELEQKRGRYVYEIELLDEQGRVWEFLVDAQDGRVLRRDRED